jgi:chromate reductase
MPTLNVLSICGSLRKGSYNAIVQRALPSLAPEGMTIKPAPSFAEFPLYNADIQNSTAFPQRSTPSPMPSAPRTV